MTIALRIALGLRDETWPQLVASAPLDPARRTRLLSEDLHELDQLAAELNERRMLNP